jgi:ribonucleoside-diphosphate reductase alpha chain
VISGTEVFSHPTTVLKRDGKTTQPFIEDKIVQAIRGAWIEAEGVVDEAALVKVTRLAISSLPIGVASVEQVQDSVETSLMKLQKFSIAKAYIVHRQRRAEARADRKKPDAAAISGYIHASKYARHRDDLGRREVYDETVARVEDMHLRRFAHIDGFNTEIREAFDLVREQRVLPSMRTLQFGGAAIETNHARAYNCSASLVDRPRVFAEAMFLLLSGCGVGYSVQYDHVDKLPKLGRINTKSVIHHVIQDSIEGWADALDTLVNSYLTGDYVEFSYHLIRPAGSPLRTSGGKAPGHLKLRESIETVRRVLDGAQERKLRPIECHKIFCAAASAVLSGGIRRSAMIALFSPEDAEMLNAKTNPQWFKDNPDFAYANNSVVLQLEDVRKKQLKRVLQMTRSYGEPGFFFASSPTHVTNPCCEIALDPVFVDENGNQHTGWSMCNLSEINAARLDTLNDFERAARAATLIGTMQATYTDFPYLGKVTEKIVRRDALLGVGMTGIQDRPDIARNYDYQKVVAEKCVRWNTEFAEKLGINAAARITCVKPSGTTSLELGSVGSGIHPHHARRYIRRVTADELEAVFQEFRKVNAGMCVRKPDGKWVIEFPVEAPEGALVKEDVSAVQFLEMVRQTQLAWVKTGTARGALNHNVSNTAVVRENEWDEVAEYLWKNKECFTGVSLLSDTGDTDYAFAPLEAVKNEAQERRWNELCMLYKTVDYSAMYEESDETALRGEIACAGGACSIA